MKKRGYFFSLDAFIALVIILGVVLFVKPSPEEVTQEVNVQGDFLEVISYLKIGDLNNTYTKQLIADGVIKNLNQSVLDQIGEFYAYNDQANATLLTNSILENLSLNENIAFYLCDDFGNCDDYGNSSSLDFANATDVWTSRQLISGVSNVSTTKGFSSRAYLSSQKGISYIYFGGYVGDGNISINLGENISSIYIEAVFSPGFINVSLNNLFLFSTFGAPWTLKSLTISSGFLSPGQTNILNLRLRDSSMYIAGGFIKVYHTDVQIPSHTKKNYLPGIQGFINIYDSFYVPGNLENMEIFLNYSSPYNVFMTIGNKTVYRGNGTNVQYTITNYSLSHNLSYSQLSNKTIPFRIGLENVSYVINITKDVDVFTVTDLSGSMRFWCSTNYTRYCDYQENCGGYHCCNEEWFCQNTTRSWIHNTNRNDCQDRWYCPITGNSRSSRSACNSTCSGVDCVRCGAQCLANTCVYANKIETAKEANKEFLNYVLNDSINNRVGLVTYDTNHRCMGDCYNLTHDNVSLINEVNTWATYSSTCICCGINRAVSMMNSQSPPSDQKFRSLVVMSDGEAMERCAQQGTGDPKQDAIQAACDAYNNYGILVYTVAFGSDADSATLMAMGGPSCGNGGFYSGGVDDLISIFKEIAIQIVNAAYYEQTIIGNGTNSTVIYPSSYVSVDYEKDIPHGLVISSETSRFWVPVSIPMFKSFTLPADAEPYEVNVVSYSGSKWTSGVEIYNNVSGVEEWKDIFNLSHYGEDYILLGDPSVVNIPTSMIFKGNNNVSVYTATSMGSYSVAPGSINNLIIYSVIKDVSSFSEIKTRAKGCNWTIMFEDSTNLSILIPSNYTGSNLCSYTNLTYASCDCDTDDAIDFSIYGLLRQLDLDLDGKVDTKFSENDLLVNSIVVEGIPFVWETEAQVRVWR